MLERVSNGVVHLRDVFVCRHSKRVVICWSSCTCLSSWLWWHISCRCRSRCFGRTCSCFGCWGRLFGLRVDEIEKWTNFDSWQFFGFENWDSFLICFCVRNLVSHQIVFFSGPQDSVNRVESRINLLCFCCFLAWLGLCQRCLSHCCGKSCRAFQSRGILSFGAHV